MKLRLVNLALCTTAAFAELVKINSRKEWDEVVGQGKPVLVKFFAPWCGFCVKMAKGYENAANDLAGLSDAVVAEVNCDDNKWAQAQFGVQGFPTLFWFDAQGNKHEYESRRDYDSIVQWILEKSPPSDSTKKALAQAKIIIRDVRDRVEFTSGLVFKWVQENAPSLEDIQNKVKSINFSGQDYKNVDHGNTDLLSLNPSNLEEIIARGNVLVKFFAPWCGHCKSMKEDYEQVAKKIHADQKFVTVAEFDCTQDGAEQLTAKYAPDGFPTVMWFPVSGSPFEFNGGRDQDSLQQFCKDNAGGANPFAGVQESVSKGLLWLNDEVGLVIRAHVEDGFSLLKGLVLGHKRPIVSTGENINRIVNQKSALVKFYAPWCGFCKRLAPEYETAAIELHAKYPNVQIVDFDCDEPVHGRIKCGEFGVSGYPTLKWFDANGDVVDYDGGRDHQGIVNWVSERMDNPRGGDNKQEL